LKFTSIDLELAMIAITAIYRWRTGRPIFYHKARSRELGLAFLAGFAVFSLAAFFVDFTIPEAEQREILEARLFTLTIVRLMIFVPLYEEYVMREILQANLVPRLGLVPTLVVVALIFGALHWPLGPSSFLFATLFGLLAGLLFQKYGFLAAVAAHSGANLSGTLVPYLVLLLH